MATSGTYSFAVNRDQIIRMAMLNIGKLDEIEVPTPQETIDCSIMLNSLMKQWVGDQDNAGGIKCWNRRTGYLFLNGGNASVYTASPSTPGWTNSFVNFHTTTTIAPGGNNFTADSVLGVNILDNIGIELDSNTIYWSTISNIVGNVVTIAGSLPSQSSSGSEIYSYTTGAQLPIEVETVVLRDAQGNDTPIRWMTLEDYSILSSKASPTYISDPNFLYWEPQLNFSYFKTDVYGSPDMSKYMVINYKETAQDITNPTDNPEFPQDWYLPLYMALSKLIAPMFRKLWTPTMEANLVTALAIAHNKDPDEVERRYFQSGED
jgi:hypothetical protein